MVKVAGRGGLSGSALVLLLVLLLLALFGLCVLGLAFLLGLGSGLFGLHLLAFGLDVQLFVDARLEEGAKLLGITRPTLYDLMNKYGIESPE